MHADLTPGLPHDGATIRLDHVFYREDETLDVDGPGLMRTVGARLQALEEALA